MRGVCTPAEEEEGEEHAGGAGPAVAAPVHAEPESAGENRGGGGSGAAAVAPPQTVIPEALAASRRPSLRGSSVCTEFTCVHRCGSGRRSSASSPLGGAGKDDDDDGDDSDDDDDAPLFQDEEEEEEEEKEEEEAMRRSKMATRSSSSPAATTCSPSHATEHTSHVVGTRSATAEASRETRVSDALAAGERVGGGGREGNHDGGLTGPPRTAASAIFPSGPMATSSTLSPSGSRTELEGCRGANSEKIWSSALLPPARVSPPPTTTTPVASLTEAQLASKRGWRAVTEAR